VARSLAGIAAAEIYRETARAWSSGTTEVRRTDLPILVARFIFGAATIRAVIELQRTARLRTDGVVGPLTWAAIEGRSRASSQDVAGFDRP
jgi:lysozyme family protein